MAKQDILQVHWKLYWYEIDIGAIINYLLAILQNNSVKANNKKMQNGIVYLKQTEQSAQIEYQIELCEK